MRLVPRHFAAVLTGLTLMGCASTDAIYPTLERRATERVTGTAPVVEAPPPLPSPPAALLDSIDSLVAKAVSAEAAFKQREVRVRGLVSAAARAPRGGEAWALATVAVAELQAVRSEAMVAMADIDALYAAARLKADSDVSAIAAAHGQVNAIIAAQDQVISELIGRLR